MTAKRKAIFRDDSFDATRAHYPVFLKDGLGMCADPNVDPDWFFPDEEKQRNKKLHTELARYVCRRCPFRVDCAQWATDTKQDGIWGGTTTQERMARRHGFTGAGRFAAAL